jgi:hypothetical protein
MEILRRIELPLNKQETKAIDCFVDDVQNAHYRAVTEECSLGEASAIIVDKALELANLLEFGDYDNG